MKKTILYSGIFSLILLCVIGFYTSNNKQTEGIAYASNDNNKVKVTDPILKNYVNYSLQNWSGSDTVNYYYKANKNIKHIEVRPSKDEDVSIEISKIKNAPLNEYNHIVKITFPNRIVILNENQKLNTTDTLTYKVNINQFGMKEMLNDSDNRMIKLIKYDHKEKPLR